MNMKKTGIYLLVNGGFKKFVLENSKKELEDRGIIIGDYCTIGDGCKIDDFCKIKEIFCIQNGYNDICYGYLNKENNEKYIQMGCCLQKVKDWENNFWNNNTQFPNDNSEKSNNRLKTFTLMKKFLELCLN